MFAIAKLPCVISLHRLEQQTMTLSLKLEPLLSSALNGFAHAVCKPFHSCFSLCFYVQKGSGAWQMTKLLCGIGKTGLIGR